MLVLWHYLNAIVLENKYKLKLFFIFSVFKLVLYSHFSKNSIATERTRQLNPAVATDWFFLQLTTIFQFIKTSVEYRRSCRIKYITLYLDKLFKDEFQRLHQFLHSFLLISLFFVHFLCFVFFCRFSVVWFIYMYICCNYVYLLVIHPANNIKTHTHPCVSICIKTK